MRRRCVYCAKSVPPSCSCDCARTYAIYALCVTRYVIINVNRITAGSCSQRALSTGRVIHDGRHGFQVYRYRYIQTYFASQSPESPDGVTAHARARTLPACVRVRACAPKVHFACGSLACAQSALLFAALPANSTASPLTMSPAILRISLSRYRLEDRDR